MWTFASTAEVCIVICRFPFSKSPRRSNDNKSCKSGPFAKTCNKPCVQVHETLVESQLLTALSQLSCAGYMSYQHQDTPTLALEMSKHTTFMGSIRIKNSSAGHTISAGVTCIVTSGRSSRPIEGPTICPNIGLI
jgi:hypothetical protein